MKGIKRCRKNHPLTHKEAAALLKLLKTNPEVCEGCDIKPCLLAGYIFGKLEQSQEMSK